MDLEKAYDRVNREVLWYELRMYDIGGKLMSGIKGMYVHSLVCAREKGDESEWFRIDSGVRQGCIISHWFFNVYMDTVMKEVNIGIVRRGESRDYLAFCMQMTWLRVASRRKT